MRIGGIYVISTGFCVYFFLLFINSRIESIVCLDYSVLYLIWNKTNMIQYYLISYQLNISD